MFILTKLSGDFFTHFKASPRFKKAEYSLDIPAEMLYNVIRICNWCGFVRCGQSTQTGEVQ